MNFRIIATIAGGILLSAGAAHAADPKLEAALKSFTSVGADAEKLKTYCLMTAAMASTENATDQTQNQEIDQKIDDYIKALGQDFSDAMNLEESLDPNSADGKAYNDAVNALDAKCTK